MNKRIDSLLAASLITWIGCASQSSAPSGPAHPANPEAVEAAAPPAAAAEGPGGESGDAAALLAAETKAYQTAKPIFLKYCAKCHTSSGSSKNKKKALEHLSMDSYPFGGHHAAEAGAEVREALGVEGEEATMPKDDPGSVKGSDLEAIVAWSRAFDRAARAGAGYHGEAHEGDHDHHGDDDHDHHDHDD